MLGRAQWGPILSRISIFSTIEHVPFKIRTISKNTRGITESCARKGACSEPSGQETTEVRGKGAQEVESKVGDECQIEYPSAAIELRKRGEDQRSRTVAEQEEGSD